MFLAVNSAVAAAMGWSIEPTPNPTGGTNSVLYSVSCVSASACTAAGDYANGMTSMTLAERWNGTKWSIENTPNPTGAADSFLYGVSCASASVCTAAGLYFDYTADLTLAEGWNGTTWSIEPTPNPSGGSKSILYSVSCPSAGPCTAVGYHDNGSTNVTLAEG